MIGIVDLVIMALFARGIWLLVRGIKEGLSGRSGATRVPQEAVHMARDPVCGTFVIPERAVSLTDGRTRLYFCSTSCRDKYRARTA